MPETVAQEPASISSLAGSGPAPGMQAAPFLPALAAEASPRRFAGLAAWVSAHRNLLAR
jgi:hypothetical protein